MLHGRDDLRARGHDPEEGRRAAVDHDIPVNRNLELAISPANHVHAGLKLAAKARRHTGGVDTSDSIRAIPDCDACHETSSIRRRTAGPGAGGDGAIEVEIGDRKHAPLADLTLTASSRQINQNNIGIVFLAIENNLVSV